MLGSSVRDCSFRVQGLCGVQGLVLGFRIQDFWFRVFKGCGACHGQLCRVQSLGCTKDLSDGGDVKTRAA